MLQAVLDFVEAGWIQNPALCGLMAEVEQNWFCLGENCLLL